MSVQLFEIALRDHLLEILRETDGVSYSPFGKLDYWEKKGRLTADIYIPTELASKKEFPLQSKFLEGIPAKGIHTTRCRNSQKRQLWKNRRFTVDEDRAISEETLLEDLQKILGIQQITT